MCIPTAFSVPGSDEAAWAVDTAHMRVAAANVTAISRLLDLAMTLFIPPPRISETGPKVWKNQARLPDCVEYSAANAHTMIGRSEIHGQKMDIYRQGGLYGSPWMY